MTIEPMTDLRLRPPDRPPTSDQTGNPTGGSTCGSALRLAPVAGVAAVTCFVTGLALCVAVAVVGWFAGTTGNVTAAVRAGADVWLLGHGAGLRTVDMEVTAAPLGLTLLAAAMLWRAGRWVGRSTSRLDARAVVVATAVLSASYGVVAVVTSVLASTDAVAVSPWRSGAGALAVSMLSGGAGLLRAARERTGVAFLPWPAAVQAAARGGAATVLVMVSAGAALVTTSLVLDFPAAANAADSLRAGPVGGAILALIGVLLLPNAVLLAVSFLLGPGFSLGAGTLVAPDGVTLGPVPDFPLLAALPESGVPPAWTAALVVVPVLAGAVGAAVTLRHDPVFGLDQAGLRGGVAGLLGGVAIGLLTGLAAGAVGPGRLAQTGPDVPACVLTAAVGCGLGGAVGGAALRWLGRRRRVAG